MTSPSVQLTLGPRVGGDPHPALAGFHPAVAEWFRRRFPEGPTTPQAEGWPHIARRPRHAHRRAHRLGQDAAPGSSSASTASTAPTSAGDDIDGTTRVVYVSPLKALAVDIAENLERPLAEIAAVAQELGLDAPRVRVAVRTGDTTSSERAAMLRRPPSFVVTTPESLYLLVTSAKGRDLAAHGRDRHRRRDPRRRPRQARLAPRAHARAPRSARASAPAAAHRAVGHAAADRDRRPPARRGRGPAARRSSTPATSATSTSPSSCPRVSSRRSPSAEQMGDVLDRIADLVGEHRTTLVFVNTRRLAERLAHQLGERLGDDVGRRAPRQPLEGPPPPGRDPAARRRPRALVATASLELGIDIGPVELVCQIGSPRSIATFLQRVGRSEPQPCRHAEGAPVPADARRAGRVRGAARRGARRAARRDPAPAACPLDILAQQIVAEAGAQEWTHRRPLRRSCAAPRPTPSSTRDQFDEVVDAGRRRASRPVAAAAARYVHHDAINGEVRGRKGARLAALTSGGAIPEIGDYRVVAEPDDTFIGTVNEDWAVESMAGDIFLLGTHSWQIRRIEAGVVRVRDAGDAAPTIPFWMGEAPARTDGAVRRGVGRSVTGRRVPRRRRSRRRARVADGGRRHPDRRRRPWSSTTSRSAAPCSARCPRSTASSSSGSSTRPAGCSSWCTRPTAGASTARSASRCARSFCRTFNFELQAAATDDAVVLSLGPHHSFPLADVPRYLSSHGDRRHPRARHPRLAHVPGPLALEPQPVADGAAVPGRQAEPAADPAHGGRRPHGRGVPAGRRLPGQRGRPDRDPRPRARAPDHHRHALREPRRRRPARAARAHRRRRRHRPLRRDHRTVGARARDPHRAARTRSSTTKSSRTGAPTRSRCGAACRSTSRPSARSNPKPSSRCTPRSSPSRRRPTTCTTS